METLGANPRDPRIIQLMKEIGANDNHKDTVARSLLPVEEPFIQEYVSATSSPLHNYKLKVESVFEIKRSGDKEFKKILPNHMLLFHGTTQDAVYPILRDGFRSSLSMETGLFGQGIYFTDCSTKAANYTSKDGNKLLGGGDVGSSRPGFSQTGYLFLAEVALGKVNQYAGPEPNAKRLLNGADSSYGPGAYVPDPNGFCTIKNSEPKIVVPMGQLMLVDKNRYLKHNEWAVYYSTQIRHTYLVKVKIV